jgi:predicted transcriptional regulator YheO
MSYAITVNFVLLDHFGISMEVVLHVMSMNILSEEVAAVFNVHIPLLH